jgi:hypothetical protein
VGLAQFGWIMTRFAFCLILAFVLELAGGPVSAAAGSNSAPDFSEIYKLIKQHAAGVTESELNRASVEGLVAALSPRVSWVTNSASGTAAGEPISVPQSSVFDGPVACIRIARVNGLLARELKGAYEALSSTNNLVGIVLDLRYAAGDDYSAAAAAADLFTSAAEPLLNWGGGVVTSHSKTNAIRVPVVVLVNHDTAGAAEALAALMREHGAGLILGSATAGQAMVTRDFPLSAGGVLRIAVAPVTRADGSPLVARGIDPDIQVAVSAEEERAYYSSAYAVMTRTNVSAGVRATPGNAAGRTNLVSRRVRMSEAELVREHRDGLDRDEDAGAAVRVAEPPKPLVNDPALARALDLLKGLALVRQGRF